MNPSNAIFWSTTLVALGGSVTVLDEKSKEEIIKEIQEDFQAAQVGIIQLPRVAKLGVYTAYSYYFELLVKLKKTQPSKLLETRVRVNNFMKTYLLCKSYLKVKFNLI